ncbi:hypothetical protein [Belnapia sp. F-4-1]|uniref:hypothetical protein n=1 Tax=Belnapia sp. F-4-1 TaxID=1545443 RepID=UPI0011862D68|nr:hypothetical protein [Belnapia sp. F-4-1]
MATFTQGAVITGRSVVPHGTLRRMRKPKTDRTADLPGEYGPGSLIWSPEQLAAHQESVYRFTEANHGTALARDALEDILRRTRDRSIKAPSDADDRAVVHYLNEEEKAKADGEQATPHTLARRAAKVLEPEDVHPDRLRATTAAVLRAVDRYKKSADGHRKAADVPDPLTALVQLMNPKSGAQ